MNSGADQARPALAWVQALRNPRLALAWSPDEWQRVLRLGRRTRLLGRLAAALQAQGLQDQLPERVRRHLVAEQRVSSYRTQAALWAMERVAITLGGAGYPIVLLKGGAYVAQGLPIAAGRLPSDVDMLVPRANLEDATARLTAAGWVALAMDGHDRRYYEEWSHEVPPMRHALHAIELDLHHNILPPVARTHVDAALLLQRVRPSALPGWWVLDPIDQVLHSAAHLFHDSEPRDRLRDLVDIDGLVAAYGGEADFWPRLAARAIELGLTESLALACWFAQRFCGTAVPAKTLDDVSRLGLPAWRRWWLLPMLERLLVPLEPDETALPWSLQWACAVFLARYQVHRLPLRHQLPHIWHKLSGDQAGADKAPDANE